MQNPYRRFPAPIVIAHRGGSGSAPENTLPSFDLAVNMDGVHALETDIHATKDGVLIAAHDESVDRMTNGTGLIKELTYAELRRLDAGYQFTPDDGKTFPFRGQGLTLPTVAEMFDRYHDWVINIDIKQDNPSIVEPFVKLIYKHKMERNLVVGSFQNHTVAEFRRQAPDVATCGSFNEILQFYLLNKVGLTRLWRGKCVAFQIPERDGKRQIITPKFVRNLQKRGMQLHVWTVNEVADMRRLLDWGVDGLITDYPERLLGVLQDAR